MRKLGVIWFFVVSLFAASSIASAQDAQPAVTFSGVLNEHVRVGATYANSRVAIFFCGDADTVATDSRWFSGAAQTWLKSGDWWAWASFTPGKNGAPGLFEAYFVTPEGWLIRWKSAPLTDGRGLYRAVTEQGTLGAILTSANGALQLQGAIKLKDPLAGKDLFSQIIPVSSTIEPVRGELEVSVPALGGVPTKVLVKQVEVIDF
jgi:hypothetical protein